MKLFELFPRKPEPRETLDWSFLGNHPAIYKSLVEGLDEAGRLLPECTILPDESAATARELAFIPGARDGYRLFHTELLPNHRQVQNLLFKFAKAVDTFESQDVEALYEELIDFDILPSLASFREALAAYPLDPARTFTLSAQLALHAADRQPLKFALVVLSFFQLPEVRALALLFSQHDEFTYYALLGLQNFPDRFQADCFLLARCTFGWGRIHATQALLGTLDEASEELEEWLIREGFHNTISDSYLAQDVIEKAGLLYRLERGGVDRGLLHASAILIAAVLDPITSGHNISELKEGLPLVKAYLRLLNEQRQTHMHQPTLLRLRSLMTEIDSAKDSELLTKLRREGWSGDRELRQLLFRSLGSEALVLP